MCCIQLKKINFFQGKFNDYRGSVLEHLFIILEIVLLTLIVHSTGIPVANVHNIYDISPISFNLFQISLLNQPPQPVLHFIPASQLLQEGFFEHRGHSESGKNLFNGEP